MQGIVLIRECAPVETLGSEAKKELTYDEVEEEDLDKEDLKDAKLSIVTGCDFKVDPQAT